MYYDNEELTNKIKHVLSKYKVKYRSLSIDDDRIVIGIEGSKSEYGCIIPKLKRLRLQPINLVYGRWVFRII